MVKIYYYKSKGIYDPRDIIYTAKFKKKKKKSTWNGEDPYSNLFKRLSLKKKKKREENVRNHMWIKTTYCHIHEIYIKDYAINPSTYMEIKWEKRKDKGFIFRIE